MLPETKNHSCYDYLKVCTEKYGDLNMVQYGNTKYTKSELFRDIDRLSAYFQNELNLKKGDIYTVFMPTSIQAIVAFYALNKIGVSVNFLHPLISSDYLKETLSNLNSKGIMIMDIFLKKHIDVIRKTGISCIVCDSSDYMKGFKKYLTMWGETAMKKLSGKIRNCCSYRHAVNCQKPCQPIKFNSDHIAVYLNGGGTTGKSKTIMLSSKAINELAEKASYIDPVYENGDEALILALPLFHCFGLCLGMHMVLCSGGRVIPMMKFNPKKFNQILMKNHIVGTMGIPLMFRKIMQEKNFDNAGLKNMKLMFCGGDDVSESFLQEFNAYLEKWNAPGRLYQGYGLTETAGVCCANTKNDNKIGSIGKPLKGIDIEIFDENHKSLPPGEIGEISVSGSTIMSGYYFKNEDGDKGIYTDEQGKKWILSGDLGYKDTDGFLYFSGRKKRIIIIAGYNVYPIDIEKKLSASLPFIKEVCAVKGLQNNKTIIRLYVSLRDNDRSKEEEYRDLIQQTCEESFSPYYVPKEIIFLDELPHTSMMKVDFMKLTEK